jgi:hypothetical protein
VPGFFSLRSTSVSGRVDVAMVLVLYSWNVVAPVFAGIISAGVSPALLNLSS